MGGGVVVGDKSGCIYRWSDLHFTNHKITTYNKNCRVVKSLSHCGDSSALVASVFSTDRSDEIHILNFDGSKLVLSKKYSIKTAINILCRDPLNSSFFIAGNIYGISQVRPRGDILEFSEFIGISPYINISSQIDFALSKDCQFLSVLVNGKAYIYRKYNLTSFEGGIAASVENVSSIASHPNNPREVALGTFDGKIHRGLISPAEANQPLNFELYGSESTYQSNIPIINLMYTQRGRLLWMDSNYEVYIW